ncbi:MAG TPA: LTA synthase family protein [Paenibacillus sp.]|uniref:LTA synthase family protein n=1 Tax=Paenibacillus TaxID=44249 RepID=UPI000BA17D5B|nr:MULTISPECIES: LTA synthase family protein [Paenibacillus]OZQ70895.1 phosphoglycerol transferase [Paenibacillus taichungensis]HBU81141.1 LTA synthase family protein [Paenibacillus sp.]
MFVTKPTRSLTPRGLLNHPLTLYLIFLVLMLLKLMWLHHNLHAYNITMGLLDKVIAIGSLLLLSFWTWWLPRRGMILSLVVIHLLLTALIYADMVYYRYFQDFLTIPVLMQARQVDALGDSIATLIHASDLWFFVDWLVIIPYAAILLSSKHHRRGGRPSAYTSGLNSYSSSSGKPSLRRRLTAGSIALILGLGLAVGPIYYYSKTWAKGLFDNNWWNVSMYNVTGLLAFHGYDLYNYAKDHLGSGPKVDPTDLEQAKAFFANRQQAEPLKDAMFGKYKDSNVIIVQGEAFMNFMIGQSIGGQEITPHFNELMKESQYYSHFYHQTGQGRTSDADFGANISMHPLSVGSAFVRYADHSYDSLPSILKDHGYSTNVFHAYESGFWNRYTMYQNMKYDKFYSKNDYEQDDPLGWSLSDESFFRQSVEKMSNEVTEPFYSFLITLTSHHPYALPQDKQQLDVGEFQGTMFGNYLQSVHYVDSALGSMVEDLKNRGLWDKTIFMFYGDHDNSIKEQPQYEKFLGRSLNDLDMEQIMNEVPLLVHLPDGAEAGTIDEPAGQLDITPSVLHLLGISDQSYYHMGNDVYDGSSRMVVLRSGAFTDSSFFYIPSDDYLYDSGSCYDLSTGAKTDINACRSGYDEATMRLHVSDTVNTFDLISRFRKEQTSKSAS